MSGWYVKRNEQKYGPYTPTQLVEMAKKGQVLPLDWVTKGDSEQWMPASQVQGLFAARPQETATAPVADPSSAPADAFAFHARPGSALSAEGASSTGGVRPKRQVDPSATRFSKPVLAAIAGGALLVILAVVYFATRGGGNNTTTAGGVGGSPQSKGQAKYRASDRQGKGAKVRDDWLAEKGEPDEFYTFPNAPYLELFVWKAGADKYDTGMVNYVGGFGNRKTNLTRRQVEFEIDFCRKVR